MNYRIVIISIVAAMLAGCGTTVPPTAAPVSASRELANPRNPLLYVGDLGNGQVDVLSYPQGKTQFTLTGFYTVNGLCTDVNGDVYVVDGGQNKIVEYAYNSKKPMRTLTNAGYFLLGCSVDSKTGDLAVAIQPVNSEPGGVAIWRHAKGKPQNLTSYGFFFPSFCAYDDKGNLYFDGSDVHGMFFFATLPYGSKTMEPISLQQGIQIGGGVQWDEQNRYVVVDDQGAGYRGSTVYEFSIKGTKATNKGTTTLGGSTDVLGIALFGNHVIGPNIGQSAAGVMYWPYPKGGKAPSKTLTGFTEPITAVVAQLPSR